MPFYEIQYETGRMSVACYENDAEAQSALKAHNDRAKNGEPGAPAGTERPWPAERIKTVFVYSKHPDAFNEAQTMSADVAAKEVADLVKASADDNNVVNVSRLSEAVAGLSHPFKTARKFGESSYKMNEDKKLALSFLGSDN